MNSIVLSGRLTSEPKMRTSGDLKIAAYRLAVDRKPGPDGKKETDFINIKAFKGAADFAERWLHQGTKLVVRGRLQMSKYTNKDGVEMTGYEVIVEDQEFGESKAEAEKRAVQTGARSDDFMVPDNVEDDGLPFN